MSRRPFEIVGLILGIALVAYLAIARQAELAAIKPSYFSTYDTGRNGYRAVFEVLYRKGVTVRRFERPLGLLEPDTGTLVISSSALEASFSSINGQQFSFLDASDIVTLRKFVSRGGRLVLLDTDYGGSQDAKLGLPADHSIGAKNAADAVAPVAMDAGVRRVEATIGVAFPLTVPKATPLLSVGSGLVAIAYPMGKGEVVAITAPDLLSNVHIAHADNAQFALDVLAGNGPVAFDERLHGYAEDQSLWSALPQAVHLAIFIVIGIVLLALIGANVRFAPVIAIEPPGDRDSSAYLTSMGSLLRRAHAAQASIVAFADDALRRARRRYGLASSAEIAEIVARADREETRRALANLERMRSLHHPDEATLIRAAVLSSRLRKDLG
jgi:hypothetical protein